MRASPNSGRHCRDLRLRSDRSYTAQQLTIILRPVSATSSMATIDPTARVSRRFSISVPRPLWIGLAAIVVIVTAAGLRLGLPKFLQQMAIRQVERLGGSVGTNPVGPEWLRSRVGRIFPIFFVEVLRVDLRGTEADDATLVHLKGFPRLYHLRLSGTRVTDTGLAHLEDLTELGFLELQGTQITDAGLVHLEGLTRIDKLVLCRTAVTGAGLANLRRMTELGWLNLAETAVTDDGLECLKGNPRLYSLDLTGTIVSDAAVAALKRPGLTIFK